MSRAKERIVTARLRTAQITIIREYLIKKKEKSGMYVDIQKHEYKDTE